MLEMLKKLKLLLGITDSSQDELLQLELDTVVDQILSYCRMKTFPEGLENVAVSLCADLHRASGNGTENGARGPVQSVKMGDTSLQFGSAFSVDSNGAMGFLKNYLPVLDRFRKVGW